MTAEILTMKSWWVLKFIKQRTVKDDAVLIFGTRMRHPAMGKQIIEMKFTVASSRACTLVEVDPRPVLPVQHITLTREQPEFTLPGALTITHLSRISSDRPSKR